MTHFIQPTCSWRRGPTPARWSRSPLRKPVLLAIFCLALWAGEGSTWATGSPPAYSDSPVLFRLGQEALTVRSRALTAPQPLWAAHLTTTLFEDWLASEGELAYSLASLQTRTERPPLPPRLLRFSLYRPGTQWRYGAKYRTVEKGFVHPLDPQLPQAQQEQELWGEGRAGAASVHLTLLRVRTTEATASRPRQSTSGRVTTALGLPAWPTVTLSYTRESSEGPREAATFFPPQPQLDTTLSYNHHPTWEATWASTVSLLRDTRLRQNRTVLWHQALSGTYRPLHTLSLAPSVSVKEQEEWGARVGTSTAALALTYSRGDRFTATLFSDYTSTAKRWERTEAKTLTTTASLEWTVGAGHLGAKTLSLQILYTPVRPGRARASLSGMLSCSLGLKVAAF